MKYKKSWLHYISEIMLAIEIAKSLNPLYPLPPFSYFTLNNVIIFNVFFSMTIHGSKAIHKF